MLQLNIVKGGENLAGFDNENFADNNKKFAPWNQGLKHAVLPWLGLNRFVCSGNEVKH